MRINSRFFVGAITICVLVLVVLVARRGISKMRNYQTAEPFVADGQALSQVIYPRVNEISRMDDKDLRIFVLGVSNRLNGYPLTIIPGKTRTLNFRINQDFGVNVFLNGGVELTNYWGN